MSESKRLAFLEKMTREGSSDPFAWYGLALEYRNLGRHEESLATFRTLREANPDYVPMYLLCGQMLADVGDATAAREWFLAGIERARAKHDTHALGELESALSTL